jgi:hypothetical protein
LQCAAIVLATGVKYHRDLFPAPVPVLATFALRPALDSLVWGSRMFADTRRVGSGVWRNRVYCARDDRPAVVGLEPLYAVIFGNEC